jgi:RadC-like JAB domain
MGSIHSNYQRDWPYREADCAANLDSSLRDHADRLVLRIDRGAVRGNAAASSAAGRNGPICRLAEPAGQRVAAIDPAQMQHKHPASVIPSIGDCITETPQIARWLMSLAGQYADEFVHAFYLDHTNHLAWSETVARGNGNRVEFDYRTLISTALRLDARGIIIGHNHPSGSAKPSRDDIVATRHLKQVCEPLGIRLIDHLIVAQRSCFSFVAEKLL